MARKQDADTHNGNCTPTSFDELLLLLLLLLFADEFESIMRLTVKSGPINPPTFPHMLANPAPVPRTVGVNAEGVIANKAAHMH